MRYIAASWRSPSNDADRRLPGFSITQAVHTLRLFQTSNCSHGHSVCILFVDVQNAFYKLVRQHIVSSQGDQRALLDLFNELRLPAGSVDEFLELCKSNRPLIQLMHHPSLKASFVNSRSSHGSSSILFC